MERTQIYFDKVEKENLIKIAKKSGKPMAEIVREAVAEYLAKEQGLLRQEDDHVTELRGFLKGNRFNTDAYLHQKSQDKELE
ncbi:MAG: CopG family transcriptional regulator [Clostridiaceae bacterium]